MGRSDGAVATDDGVEVDCWYMKPAGFEEGKQYPVVLNIHGGPFGQYGETFLDEFQVYTGAGYGVVFCNPRGSSGQSTAFARALVGDMGGPDFHDVMTAFEAALARMPWADQSRLGVMGGRTSGDWTIARLRPPDTERMEGSRTLSQIPKTNYKLAIVKCARANGIRGGGAGFSPFRGWGGVCFWGW